MTNEKDITYKDIPQEDAERILISLQDKKILIAGLNYSAKEALTLFAYKLELAEKENAGLKITQDVYIAELESSLAFEKDLAKQELEKYIENQEALATTEETMRKMANQIVARCKSKIPFFKRNPTEKEWYVTDFTKEQIVGSDKILFELAQQILEKK